MSNILVTGSASGLGKEIAAVLCEAGHQVYEFDQEQCHDVTDPRGTYGDPPERLEALINCAGINGQNYIEDMSEQQWMSIIDTNAGGIFAMTKWALPRLKESKGTVLNIISNASHTPMTASLAYNASKGAAHIMTLQMARELGRRFGLTVFGISPNKIKDTAMSETIDSEVCRVRGWTREEAHEYQLAGLLMGKEIEPRTLAEFIGWLFESKKHHKHFAGCVIPYGA